MYTSTLVITLLLGAFRSSCMKSLLSVFTAVTVSTAPVINAEPDVFMSFDFQNGELERGFDDWYYSDKGENPCGVYAGDLQSKLCSSTNSKMYAYYNYYNSNHMGWLRYGFIDASSKYSVSGSSLKVTLTGGVKQNDSSGDVEEHGVYSKSKSDFEESINTAFNLPDHSSSDEVLPGDLSIYFKTSSNGQGFNKLQNKNRFSVWVLMPQASLSFDEQSSQHSSRPSHTLGWYPFVNNANGGHYYHLSSNIAMGGWTKIQFDGHPTHHNSGSNNEYSAFSSGGYDYPGNGVDYFNNIVTFAIRNSFSAQLPTFSEFYIDEIETALVEFENEETINNLGIGYDPERKLFDISFEDKYRCLQCKATYLVKYAFEPITNENFQNASTPKTTINFRRSDSNSEGKIIKPNPGYNQIWAALDIDEHHKALLQDGKKIYFAVKDISDRSEINQQSTDFKEVEVPGMGRIKQQDLIKSIEYKIIDIVFPLKAEKNRVDGVVGHFYEESIDISGGVKPYRVSGTIANGLSIDSQGNISGIPTSTSYNTVEITIRDSVNNELKKTLIVDIKDEQEYDIPRCGLVVDLKASANESYFSDSRFNYLTMDKYTSFVSNGTAIKIGSNETYDFVSVHGEGFTLYPGDKIRTTWRNDALGEVNFKPKLSFTVADRPSNTDTINWLDSSQITIPAKGVEVSEYLVETIVHSEFITVNVNKANHATLILDKIELVESSRELNEVCHKVFANKIVSDIVLVDFEQSIDSSVTQVPNLNKIILDTYTGFLDKGVTTVVGSNGNYNFQGVMSTASGFEFYENDEILLYWMNVSDETITSSPKVSFTDWNRVDDNHSESWLELPSLSLVSGERTVQRVRIGKEYAGERNVVNISNQLDSNKALVLDKIILRRRGDTLEFLTHSLKTAIQFQPFNDTLEVSKPTGLVFDVTLSGLPQGLYFDGKSKITGTPLSSGTFEVLAALTDNSGTRIEKTFTLNIADYETFTDSKCKNLATFSNNFADMDNELVSELVLDKYTGLTNYGTSNVVGSAKSYNFTALLGEFNYSESTIRTVWYNDSDTNVSFQPLISFNHVGRISDATEDHLWFPMQSITVAPKSYMVSKFPISGPEFESLRSVINVNVNHTNHRTLHLHKIELISNNFNSSDKCNLPLDS